MNREAILLVTRQGAVRFDVHVSVRARRTAMAGVRGGALVVRLAAPPVDGAANAELVATLAGVLSVPARDVRVVRGAASRHKVVEVSGMAVDDVRARLDRQLAGVLGTS